MAMRSTPTMASATNIAVRNAACINGDNLNCCLRRRLKTMHRFIRSILRFIIRHKRINHIFSKWKWFNHLCYEEAQAVIGNRPWKQHNLPHYEVVIGSGSKKTKGRNYGSFNCSQPNPGDKDADEKPCQYVGKAYPVAIKTKLLLSEVEHEH